MIKYLINNCPDISAFYMEIRNNKKEKTKKYKHKMDNIV